MKPAQSFSVKRAQVEFHNFASLGEPETVLRAYAEENVRRGGLIRRHLSFIGLLTPFLEIGANAGHSSYMLANEFNAEGFALDISADALRHGIALQHEWDMPRAPIRMAGDAVHLPFADNSLQVVLAYQMLSQFLDIESVFIEVKRVLAPGGIFIFSEEPILRKLSLRLYRCPYYATMKPWERKLHDWGLLGYLVRDVIGAHQEENFGIRQNHTMALADWTRLVEKHFTAHEFEMFAPDRGWGESIVKRIGILSDGEHSQKIAARWLGGTLSAFCRKGGVAAEPLQWNQQHFEQTLRCPDCHHPITRAADETLNCTNCAYIAPDEGGVYNLLPSGDKKELYPGDRADIIDFSQPGHESKLHEGWYGLEGIYGNKYRWMGERVTATLERVHEGPMKIRLRGFAQESIFEQNQSVELTLNVNGQQTAHWTLERSGMTVLETPVPDAPIYQLEINVSPPWKAPGDDRPLTIIMSMIRLVPVD